MLLYLLPLLFSTDVMPVDHKEFPTRITPQMNELIDRLLSLDQTGRGIEVLARITVQGKSVTSSMVALDLGLGEGALRLITSAAPFEDGSEPGLNISISA
jgi:hypothetical protein